MLYVLHTVLLCIITIKQEQGRQEQGRQEQARMIIRTIIIINHYSKNRAEQDRTKVLLLLLSQEKII